MHTYLDANLNSIFDYEFTPESHFFLVFVNSSSGERAVFTKLAYLFEAGLPKPRLFNKRDAERTR